MSLTRKSFTNIISPSSTFDDDVYDIKQDKVYYEQGFNLNFIDALSGASDVKINNYSSLYLTNLKLDEEIFRFNEIVDTQDDYITYIAYRDSGEPYLLTFDLINTYNSNAVHSYSFVLCSEVTDFSRTYFEIETLDETYCRIKRRENETLYYLVYDDSSPYNTNFYFTTSIDASDYVNKSFLNKDLFYYVLDKQGYAVFLKRSYSKTYMVGINPSTVDFSLCSYDSSFNYFTGNTLFGVKLIDNLISNKKNTSWVSYEYDNLNDIKVNNSESSFDLKNNNVLSLEYNNIDNINKVSMNVLKLKNQHTHKNVTSRSNANVDSSYYLPAPFFREYSSLVTGNNEEKGYVNLGLNYLFYNQDYLVETGKSTVMYTPSSIFPYTRLNINDSSFAKEGSIFSVSPVLADKIYKEVENQNDNLKGSYLVTWLSGSSNYPIWLDRYYFPNILDVKDALSGDPIFTPTFDNAAAETAYDNENAVYENPYYDVISNFTILPNEKYIYERVGNEFLLNYINNYQNIIQYNFSSYINSFNNIVNIDATELDFNGDKIVSIPIDMVNDSGSFSIFFKVTGNWKQKLSYLFGSLVDAGFAIYSDERITPFIYYKNDRSVFVTNRDNTILYSLSFDSPVLDVITDNHLNDYFVTTTNNDIYKVGSDGAIKEKYDLGAVTQSPDGVLGTYINYHKSGNEIYFLADITGDYAKLNIDDGNITVGSATPFFSSGDNGLFRSIYKYNNNVYCFYGDKIVAKGNTLYNLVSNTAINSYNLDVTGTQTVFTTSKTRILDFNVDNDGTLYVLHNYNKLALIDKNRKLISDNSIVRGATGYRIDFYSDFTDRHNMYPIILLGDSFNNSYLLKYTRELSGSPTPLSFITQPITSFDYNANFDLEVLPSVDITDTTTLVELSVIGLNTGSAILVNDFLTDNISNSVTFDVGLAPSASAGFQSISAITSTVELIETTADDDPTIATTTGTTQPYPGAQDQVNATLVQNQANLELTNFIIINKPQPLTNYNAYIDNESYKYLNFKLILKNIYDPRDISNIEFSLPLDKLSDYANSFFITYDDKEGSYDIYVNGIKVFSKIIDKSKYTFNVLLNNSFILGSLGFYNNVPISQFVKIPGYLYGSGYSVSNLRYFSSRLTDEQIQGLFLQNDGVKDAYLTIPCGQRNNVETIKSIFKFTQPYAKSNSVNLLIKNSGITNTTLQREISSNLLSTLDDVFAGDTMINEIKFINY